MTHGYNYGDPTLERSPVTPAELDQLLQTVLWTDTDRAALRRAGELLGPHVEEVLDVWYGFVGSHPFLVSTFAGADGQPDAGYLSAVRGRFARWIIDVCERDWDQIWLDHQHALARRHHRTGKNHTDHITSTSAEVPMRYLVAFIIPLTVTMGPFLDRLADDPEQAAAMLLAWTTAVALTAVLWTQPYSSGW